MTFTRFRSWVSEKVTHTLLLAVVTVSILPLVVLVTNSLKSEVEVRKTPLGLPATPLWSNYNDAWSIGDFQTAMLNSAFVSTGTVIIVSVLAGLAAYGLARLRPIGNTQISVYFLLGMAVPPQLFLIPLFGVLQRLNLVDNLAGLMLTYVGIYLPFSVYFLRAYFLGVPRELDDAAKIDGCSDIDILTKIILPVARPAFQSLAVILVTWTWNEFLFAITLLHSPTVKTAAVQFVAFTSSWDVNLAYIAASGIITFLPIVVLFLCLQRQFIEGMVQGGFR